MANPSLLAARQRVLSLLFVSCLLATAVAQAPTTYRFAREGALGTSSHLAVRAADEATGKRADAAVFAEVERLAAVLSTWDAQSELSRLVAAGGDQAGQFALRVPRAEHGREAFDLGEHRRVGPLAGGFVGGPHGEVARGAERPFAREAVGRRCLRDRGRQQTGHEQKGEDALARGEQRGVGHEKPRATDRRRRW